MILVGKILIPLQRPSPLNTITEKSNCLEITLDKIRASGDDAFRLGFVIDVHLKEEGLSDSIVSDSYFRFVRYQNNWIWTELFYNTDQTYLPLTGHSRTFEEGLNNLLNEVNE